MNDRQIRHQADTIWRNDLSNSNIVFTVVILAGYVILLTEQELSLSLWEIMLVLILGLVYTIMGLAGYHIINGSHSLKINLIYIGLMVALGGAINYLSHTNLWLILLPICSHAIEHLPRRWGIAVNICVFLVLLFPLYNSQTIEETVLVGAQFLASLVFVFVFTQSLVHERQMRSDLSNANQKLRETADMVEEYATMQERNRLAREIHDGLGHYLTAINIQIKAAQSVINTNTDTALETLENARNLTQEALADVRRSVSTLRNEPSFHLPLDQIIARLIEGTRTAGLEVNLQIDGEVYPLSQQIEFTLYRIIQEALTNACKYSEGSQVIINLDYREEHISLEIMDDGVGTEYLKKGFGLIGLSERVQTLNGNLSYHTAPSEGFVLQVEIPT